VLVKIKKLLYLSHLKEPTWNLLEGLLAIKQIGLEEIILLSEGLPQGLQERSSEHGIHLKRDEGSGPLIPRMIETAHRERASLIVAHLQREKRRFFGGGTAWNLIKNTPFPLLIMHENTQAGTPSIKRLFDSVILATDWSDASGRAWLYMIGIKEIVGTIDIVYVLNERPTIGEIRQLKERVEEVRKICLAEDMDAESHIYAGKTADEIVLASKDYNATMIAMGYKPTGGLNEIFSRSSCCRVIEKSSVPVLIIP
jgi:nucleotide-binding universal stress UspA family protein